MKIKIKNDLFDIAARLRELDAGYGVVFDTDSQRYLVTLDGKSVLTLPFDDLDERTIRHVYYTRGENALKVAEDIDKHNERLFEDGLKRAQDNFEDEFSRAMRLNGN